MNLDKLITFVEKPSQNLYAVKVLEGPYTDVIYTYGKVRLHEDEPNGELKLQFDFNVNDVPKNLNKEELNKSEEFRNFMGDILTQLLEEKNYNDRPTDTHTQDAS